MTTAYASGLLNNIQPPTEAEIKNLPEFTASNIADIAKDRKVLHQSYLSGKTRSYEWRVQNLKNLRQLVIENQELLCHAAYHDFKAIGPVSQEIAGFISEVENNLENLKSWMKPTTKGSPWAFLGNKSKIYHEPLGTVLVIAPWNFPIMLSFEPIIGAISAGNCVVLKPSELTPYLSAAMANLFPKYLDPECFKVYNGGPEVATELLKQRWDYIFYTGNGAVGRIIMRAAAEHLTPVTLELGGKSPAVVDLDTIDVNAFAKRLFFGKLFNSGQVCVGIDYILTLPQHVEPIVTALKKLIHECLGDDPLKSDELQKIVNDRHVQRLLNLLPGKDSKKDGEIAYGGRYNLTERKIEPTIIINPDPESAKVMKEEIFGPILPIVAMNSFEECFDYIKSHDKPLASYMFSSNSKLIEKFKVEISSGGQCINESILHVAHPHFHFGGVGESGIGAYHGKHSFDIFSHHKPVLEKDWLLTTLDKVKIPPTDYDLTKAANFPKVLRPSIAESWFFVRWYYNFSMTFKWLYILIKAISTSPKRNNRK